MILPVRASATQASSAYHGLTPNMSAMTRPIAGYQATNPIREKRTTSGRFSRTYSSTNERETRAWRMTRCRECINRVSAPDRLDVGELLPGVLHAHNTYR